MRYSRKQLEEITRVKRKNKSPEQDFVSNDLMPWLKANKFDCNVFESKSVWDTDAGRYIKSQVIPGHPDVAGNDTTENNTVSVAPGTPVHVYLKKKGPMGWTYMGLGETGGVATGNNPIIQVNPAVPIGTQAVKSAAQGGPRYGGIGN